MQDIKIALISLQKEGDRVIPLGLVSIATYLEQKKNIKNIRIIDRNFENITKEIIKYKPDLIGISAMTILYKDAMFYANEFKNILAVPIIIGGVHISTLPTSLKKCFDIGIIGEGEETFAELVELYRIKKKFKSTDLGKINGLVFWNNGKLEITNKRELINNLDDIPIPDYKYIDDRYFDKKPIIGLDMVKRRGWIITSRGCPYKCVFCSTKQLWDKVRFHSSEYIVKNIEYLLNKYDVKHIIIMDDLFSTSVKRVSELVNVFKKKRIPEEVTFTIQARANTINDELCALLKQINVKILQFGFESGSKRILSWLKGNTVTPEINFNAIRTVQKSGMKVFGSFMFGVPGETIEDMKKTINFIKKAKDAGVNYIFIFVAIPYPATQFWTIAKEREKVCDDMDFKKLSLYAKNEPLLLDEEIEQKDFSKLFIETNRLLRPLKYKMLYNLVKKNFGRILFMNLESPIYCFQKVYRFLFKR